ncbi:TPA: hypothetical protein ACGY2Z_001595 [Listeria monocytogenes]
MSKKLKNTFKISLGLVLIALSACFIYSSLQHISWLENSSKEDRTRYFLQEKFNDDWKHVLPSIVFEFNVESGRNKLITKQFEISAQVENKKDDFHTFNTSDKNELSKLIFFDILVTQNLEASTVIEKQQAIYMHQLPLDINNEIFEIQFSNHEYQINQKMEQKLGIPTINVVQKVTLSQEEYQSLLKQMTSNELATKKILRNITILICFLVLASYLYLIVIRPVASNRRSKNQKKSL